MLSLSALLIAGLACGGGSSTTGTASDATNAGTSAPLSSSKGDGATSAARNIAGSYDANGTNPDVGTPYKASLVVTPRDDVYQFSWTSGNTQYDGVGVTTDNAVAVSYTTGTDGKGCGVVLYKINGDGSLDGKSGYWGVNSGETEKAVRKSGTDLEGDYDVTGQSPNGKDYKGTLKVAREGQGYAFNWSVGNNLEGFGIRSGDLVSVGFGGKQCSFVAYEVRADGTLDGKWGGRASKTLGTEVAKKK